MLNWLARYAAIISELDLGPDGALRESVLDVGCGPHGLSIVAPNARFAGIDIDFGDTALAPGMIGFRGSAGPLPFEDASFDTVICQDVLEHVPPEDRAAFIAELARVSARRVFVACPTDAGSWVEDLLREGYAAGGIPLPGWLNEHDEHGLPTRDEIIGWAEGLEGFTTRWLPLVNGFLSGLIVLGDMLPGLAARAELEWEQNREQWIELLAQARFGATYRGGYVIARRAACAPILSADLLAATSAAPALRCTSCGRASVTRSADALACGHCGAIVERDRFGVWEIFRPTRPAAAETDGATGPATPSSGPPRSAQVNAPASAAPLTPVRGAEAATLILRPASWADPLTWLPALSTYIALVPAERPTTLYLDAREPDVGPRVLRGLAGFACEQLAEGEDFAAVALLEDGVPVPDGAVPVDGVDGLVECLGLTPPAFLEEPALIVDHARWAKHLADTLRAEADRFRFECSTPDLSGEPLVTVRIPTWGATEPLVERAIASALHQDWRNVEVLVCSDGPQPHARQAVAAICDRRVRYLEVERRPVYPARRESFWQTAGTWAVNHLLDEARGAVIAPLDHDDAFTHTHVRRLVAELCRGADFAYGQAMTEYPDGDWRLLGRAPLTYGEIVHATVAYTARLGHMRYDPHAWLLGEPGDWNMWRRIQATGADIRHVPEPVAVHFKERSSIDGQQRTLEEDAAEMAADVLATSASQLLTVRRRATSRTPVAVGA